MHWLDELGGGTMADSRGSYLDQDVVIVSIDPDFIFLKPFGMQELGLTSIRGGGGGVRDMLGKPVAQDYGLGRYRSAPRHIVALLVFNYCRQILITFLLF